MTVASTSISAFKKVKLGPKQIRVHNALRTLGRATDLELSDYLNEEINEVTPRRNELVKLGHIKEDGRKTNRTGNTAKAWVVSEPALVRIFKRIQNEDVEDYSREVVDCN